MKTWSDGEAEMVRCLLEVYEIPCQVVSDIPHSVFPLTVDGLGEVRILVPERHFERAQALIAEHRRQGFQLAGNDETHDEDGDGERADNTGQNDAEG